MSRFTERLNWIRAAVLGANDGIVSVAATLVGIAAARPLALGAAALAATLAGACSMALGEYVSVRAQVDAESEEGQPLTVNPWTAAVSSALSFTSGAALPSIAILASPPAWRIPITLFAVITALGICGALSARWSHTAPLRPALRVMAGGTAALGITYVIGHLAA
ncbi:hypothetical protein E2F47_06155 [Mycobacterium eburneum]|nr:VIT1/CCC1 transporter family protein [Mycobacterium eburneum]TDH56710.1 hypothetical protein E2F47_06155 [Mycobacterium eburneum]